jgi:hypothetical protein
VNETLQIKGQTVEDFICEAQDRSRNARSKSELAAFNSWKEQLLCDQAQFEAERLMILRICLQHILQKVTRFLVRVT